MIQQSCSWVYSQITMLMIFFIPMLLAGLFMIAKVRKLPKCSWMDKVVCEYKMEYYSPSKNNEIWTFAITWIVVPLMDWNLVVWSWQREREREKLNLEKEEWNWRNQPAWLQTLLQSHSHQDSMVLAQRQIYRSMEQNRKLRDKSTNLWSPYLRQRRQGYTME